MNNAATARPLRSPLAPAWERARLRIAPRRARRRTPAPRVPFLVLVSVILVAGVVGLLMFNTSMQQAAFTQSKLQQEADALAARQQALTMQLQRLDDPQRIAAAAQAQGMVIPGPPVVLSVPSGKVEGVPTPADSSGKLQLWALNPAPKYATKVVPAG